MSELSYKELQEQGIFDVPYRAFEFMQSQQAKIDELQARIDEVMKYVSESPLKDVSRRAMINFMDILKGNKDEN